MITGRFGIVCFSPGYGGLEMNTLRLMIWMEERGWQIELLVKEGTAIAEKAMGAGLSVRTIPSDNPSKQDIKAIHDWVTNYSLPLIFIPYNSDIKLLSRYKRNKNKQVKLVYQQHMQVGVKKRDFIHTRRYKMLDAWISPLQYLKEEER